MSITEHEQSIEETYWNKPKNISFQIFFKKIVWSDDLSAPYIDVVEQNGIHRRSWGQTDGIDDDGQCHKNHKYYCVCDEVELFVSVVEHVYDWLVEQFLKEVFVVDQEAKTQHTSKDDLVQAVSTQIHSRNHY